MNKKEALKALKLAKNKLAKKYDIMDNVEVKPLTVVTTGSAIIDDATGIGGLATGRLYEMFGLESSGKSSSMYSVVAQFQKAFPDKFVAYIDTEQAVNLQYMAQFGVDTNELEFQQPETAEEALEIINTYAQTGVFSLIVLDSIAAMQTKAQLEKTMEDKTIGSLSGVLSPGLTKIKTTCKKTDTTLFLINQVRDKITMLGAMGYSTPGGHAPKFYSSIRMEVKKKDTVTDANGDAIGIEVEITFKKNKLGVPFKVIRTRIMFGKGFDFEAEYFDMAVAKKIVNKAGAWMDWISSTGEKIKVQGRLNGINLLRTNTKEFEYLKDLVKNHEIKSVSETLSLEEQLKIQEEEKQQEQEFETPSESDYA